MRLWGLTCSTPPGPSLVRVLSVTRTVPSWEGKPPSVVVVTRLSVMFATEG